MDKEKNREKMVVYDLVFGIILIAICVFFTFESVAMPRPRTWLTAPGMPPLVIFISLGCMGIGLLVSAIKAHGVQLLKAKWNESVIKASDWRGLSKNKTILLSILFFLYFLVFTKIFPFELSTFIYLFVILKIFWKRSLLITLVASLIVTVSFSLVFSEFFKVMLPGVDWRDFLPI